MEYIIHNYQYIITDDFISEFFINYFQKKIKWEKNNF